jgi:hypothetical protein
MAIIGGYLKGKKMRIFIIIGLTLTWAFPSVASVDINGNSFADRRQVAGSELRLTGTALLDWAVVFDVYWGAFYLPEHQPASRWAEDVPKLLELSYQRKFKAEDLVSSSDKLLRKTLSPEQYQAIAERLKVFFQLFRDIRSGDRYTLVYHPTIGTELRLNGQALGSVPGHNFAVAYFGLWFGSQPISENFRDRLLGG